MAAALKETFICSMPEWDLYWGPASISNDLMPLNTRPPLGGVKAVSMTDGAFNTQILSERAIDQIAHAAIAYRGLGKSGWYIPSIEELKTIYECVIVRKSVATTTVHPTWYWSSTEHDKIGRVFYRLHMKTGEVKCSPGSIPCHIRFVRREYR